MRSRGSGLGLKSDGISRGNGIFSDPLPGPCIYSAIAHWEFDGLNFVCGPPRVSRRPFYPPLDRLPAQIRADCLIGSPIASLQGRIMEVLLEEPDRVARAAMLPDAFTPPPEAPPPPVRLGFRDPKPQVQLTHSSHDS